MIEVAVIVALLIYIGFKEYSFGKERKHMIHAIMSKSPKEMAEVTLADKTEVKIAPKVEQQPQPDVVSLSEVSDEDFFKAMGMSEEKDGN